MSQKEGISDVLKSPEAENAHRYALLSVYDKAGIVDFARTLDSLGYRIISSGGTAKTLSQEGINVTPVEEITGNPESFDGRMKTISFEIESGILYDRRKPSHVEDARRLNVPKIELVVCNLYPFEKTIGKQDVTLDEAIENIDVGGPTMVRAAAKNFPGVLVVTDPNDYDRIAKALEEKNVTGELRQELSAKAFAHLSLYDSLIASFLRKELFPNELTIPLRKVNNLRYGDNPHQEATVYLRVDKKDGLVGNLKSLSGRELSMTNLTDIDAGYKAVQLFDADPCAVVIKHNSPCGVALGTNIAQALSRAIEGDPESAFGGVVVVNRTMDKDAAAVIAKFKEEKQSMMDIIAAPDFDTQAMGLIDAVRKTTGIYSFGKVNKLSEKNLFLKDVDGGIVTQTSGWKPEEIIENWEIVTKKAPYGLQFGQMITAWYFINRIKSNTVIVVDRNDAMTRGIGSGQTSRFRSTEIALKQAGKHTKGAILASDSFFPFDDSVKLAVKYGIGAIIQQGGSKNDQDSIDATNKAGIPMVFTHQRAFWH